MTDLYQAQRAMRNMRKAAMQRGVIALLDIGPSKTACLALHFDGGAALAAANDIIELEADNCRRIGEHGVALIREIRDRKQGGAVTLLTHCNAGRLACIEYGTAKAPMYVAREEGRRIHVRVDETRPPNKGSRLKAWGLGKAGRSGKRRVVE